MEIYSWVCLHVGAFKALRGSVDREVVQGQL